MLDTRDTLVAKTVEFCEQLRAVHGFNLGPREALEAVQALEIVGIRTRRRVAAALRAICCSKPEEIEPFDRAFDAFFASEQPGISQRQHKHRRPRSERDETAAQTESAEIERQPDSESAADAWQALLARYSPSASAANAPAIPTQGLGKALREADRLIARLHLGRSLRWKPQARGERFDLRRTLRASLATGGDLFEPHTLGHPLRNPHFVVLLDGSRSMTEHVPRMLQFVYALCKRTRRATAFIFSTRLQEVTRKLREADRDRSYRLADLGESWGGGTRIGASLSEFLRKYGTRLSDQTFVVIVSDGLDVGEVPRLRRAMRELSRRCAAIAWVNPDAARPGYVPSAHGMQAALPYVTAFTSFERLDALAMLGRRSSVLASA